MKKEGGSALRRSRGKFTTLNAFARRSEVEVGGDGADSGKETSYRTTGMSFRMGDAGIVHSIIPRGQVIITFVHFFIRTKFVLPQVTEIDMNLT